MEDPRLLYVNILNNRILDGYRQGCGSGSGLDPDLIGLVDPNPDSESGSGSMRTNDPQK